MSGSGSVLPLHPAGSCLTNRTLRPAEWARVTGWWRNRRDACKHRARLGGALCARAPRSRSDQAALCTRERHGPGAIKQRSARANAAAPERSSSALHARAPPPRSDQAALCTRERRRIQAIAAASTASPLIAAATVTASRACARARRKRRRTYTKPAVVAVASSASSIWRSIRFVGTRRVYRRSQRCPELPICCPDPGTTANCELFVEASLTVVWRSARHRRQQDHHRTHRWSPRC